MSDVEYAPGAVTGSCLKQPRTPSAWMIMPHPHTSQPHTQAFAADDALKLDPVPNRIPSWVTLAERGSQRFSDSE
jgi:hypothetical protein